MNTSLGLFPNSFALGLVPEQLKSYKSIVWILWSIQEPKFLDSGICPWPWSLIRTSRFNLLFDELLFIQVLKKFKTKFIWLKQLRLLISTSLQWTKQKLKILMEHLTALMKTGSKCLHMLLLIQIQVLIKLLFNIKQCTMLTLHWSPIFAKIPIPSKTKKCVNIFYIRVQRVHLLYFKLQNSVFNLHILYC